jgi:predicted transcriptional regulator
MNTSTLSTRPTDQTKKKLDQLAKAATWSMAFLVAKAVQSYVEEQAWSQKQFNHI